MENNDETLFLYSVLKETAKENSPSSFDQVL